MVAATLVAGMLGNYAVWGVLLSIGHLIGITRAHRTSARFRRSQELLETKMRVTNNRFVPTETLADLRREYSLHRLVQEHPDLGGTTPAQ